MQTKAFAPTPEEIEQAQTYAHETYLVWKAESAKRAAAQQRETKARKEHDKAHQRLDNLIHYGPVPDLEDHDDGETLD